MIDGAVEVIDGTVEVIDGTVEMIGGTVEMIGGTVELIGGTVELGLRAENGGFGVGEWKFKHLKTTLAACQ